VKRHVEEEEGEAFPKVRDALGQERLFEIGEAMERAKKVAPTRPHPYAPSTPPANLVAGPAAGVMDRAREAGRGRVVAIALGAAAVGLVVWRVAKRREAA
jgi:hypothetical protein